MSGGAVDPADPNAAKSGNTFYRGVSDKDPPEIRPQDPDHRGVYYRIYNLIYLEKV